MTLSLARKKFKQLADAIVKDGKVSYEETDVLLDFIDTYVEDCHPLFVKFKYQLISMRKDGKISDEESKQILAEISNIQSYLKSQQILNAIFFGLFALIVISIIIAAALH